MNENTYEFFQTIEKKVDCTQCMLCFQLHQIDDFVFSTKPRIYVSNLKRFFSDWYSMRHRFNCHYYSALKLNDLFQFFLMVFFLFFSFSQRDAREKNYSLFSWPPPQSVSQIEMIGNVCALRNLKRQSNRWSQREILYFCCLHWRFQLLLIHIQLRTISERVEARNKNGN